MNFLRRVINDLKKYREYMIFCIKSSIKLQVAGTNLGYFWWILDPLFFMFVYTVFVLVIRGKTNPEFPIFIFCALVPWKWTATSISGSADSIAKKRGILEQIYIPKFIFPLMDVVINLSKFIFGILVLLILLPLFKINFSFHIFEAIVIVVVQGVFLIGLSLIIAHLGIYFRDIRNILQFAIQLWFYMSPGIYTLEYIPEKYRFLWWLNPMTTFFYSYRNTFMYNHPPLYLNLFIILIISLILVIIGLIIIYKSDKNYTKVV